MTLGKTLQEVVGESGDTLVPIFLPPAIIDKCNDLILSALKDHNLPSSVPPLTPALKEQYMQQIGERMARRNNEVLLPTLWHIDSITAWQLIDRRIDEYVSRMHFGDNSRHDLFSFPESSFSTGPARYSGRFAQRMQ